MISASHRYSIDSGNGGGHKVCVQLIISYGVWLLICIEGQVAAWPFFWGVKDDYIRITSHCVSIAGVK